jgi:hypothetical protein
MKINMVFSGHSSRPFPFDVCFYFDVYLGEKQRSKQTIIYLRNELRQSKKYYKLKVVILGKKVCNHFIQDVDNSSRKGLIAITIFKSSYENKHGFLWALQFPPPIKLTAMI